MNDLNQERFFTIPIKSDICDQPGPNFIKLFLSVFVQN
jgi:hypothetical protein